MVTSVAKRFLAGGITAVAVMLAGCTPNLDDTTSIVTVPTVIAIQSTPAEAPPMAPVKYTALVASGVDGGAPRLVWDYCEARNPLTNLGPINPSCAQPGSPALVSLGQGLLVSSAVPGAACSNFGPNAPPATDGGAGSQAVDPDSTGGYYQPLNAFLDGNGADNTLYLMRVSCGFSGASEASQGALTARYHVNTNPAVASLTGGGATFVTADAGATNPVVRGAKVDLVVAWPTCPLVDRCGDGVCGADESLMTCPTDCTTPRGCAGAERYVNLDITSQTVVDQREGVHVSWYATAGTFDQDRTGNDGTNDATTSDNGWTAPSKAGPVTLWVVLHDDRGGIGWATYGLDVH